MTAGSISVPTIVPLRAPVSGKLKNAIDENTAIELSTETPNAEIFFTVDGSKPEPFAPLGVENNTIKYTRPFKLREGKRTIKAIGLSRDGTRQSHMVTKTFDVTKYNGAVTEGRSDTFAFIDELEKERKKELSQKKGILKKTGHNMSYNESFRSHGSLSDTENGFGRETRYLGQRFAHKPQAERVLHLSNEDLSSSNHRFVLPDSSTQALRLQRETDFMKCIYCFANRPHDPYARFCSECGKQLPEIPKHKLPPPEAGQMGLCYYCKSTVPLNTKICVVCENPISPQLQPQASIKLQGKIICPVCMTGNPSNYTQCVTCETKLPSTAKIYPTDYNMIQYTQPSIPSDKRSTCSQCFRINNSDARYCDWCGAKPQRSLGPIHCKKCGANNHPYTRFCITCGGLVQPPEKTFNSYAYMTTSQTRLGNGNNAPPTWLSAIDSQTLDRASKHYTTVSTQTFGIFYPNTNTKVEVKKEDKKADKENERKPLLTSISAGKGYWRQQMDHICAHLKAYAQSNAEFRSLVGEPRLGKIESAKVDIDPNWCTLTINFPIRNNVNKDLFNSSALIDHNLTMNNTRLTNADYNMISEVVASRNSSISDDSLSSFGSEESFPKHVEKKTKKIKKTKTLVATKSEMKLTAEDRQLIKELSKSGKGRPNEVEDILKEGANPNAETKEGLSMLHLAIRNKHFNCIQVLLNARAEINARIPPKDNTPLHEAVLLGSDCEKVIDKLLENGANPNLKNKRNETPYDLACNVKNDAAINALGSHTGGEMIKQVFKSTKT